MTILNAIRLSVVLATSLLLSGCFVTSKQMPAGTGPINDDAIVGDWRGLDSDTGKEEQLFIHIQKHDPAQPLRVIFVEDKKYEIYDLRTTQVGNRHVFSAKILEPAEAVKESHGGSFLGYYEAKGDEVDFYLLDAKKVSDLIRQHKVRGNAGKDTFDFAELTGSPAELAAFFASNDGWNARVDNAARLRRLPAPK
jgi:hypothetical protein